MALRSSALRRPSAPRRACPAAARWRSPRPTAGLLLEQLTALDLDRLPPGSFLGHATLFRSCDREARQIPRPRLIRRDDNSRGEVRGRAYFAARLARHFALVAPVVAVPSIVVPVSYTHLTLPTI